MKSAPFGGQNRAKRAPLGQETIQGESDESGVAETLHDRRKLGSARRRMAKARVIALCPRQCR